MSRIQPATRKRAEEAKPGQARQGQDDRRGGNSGDDDDRQPRLEPAADVLDRERDGRQRRHRSAVDQAEQEEGERDGSEARRAPAATADDRDADHLVATAGQRDPADRRSTAGGREREDGRPLLGAEQTLPAPCLGGVGAEEDDGCEPDEPEVGAVERPAAVGEMARDERGHHESDQHEAGIEEALERQGLKRLSAAAPPTRIPHFVASLSSACGRSRSLIPPSADVSSLGITHTLLASPWAICGSTCRYW